MVAFLPIKGKKSPQKLNKNTMRQSHSLQPLQTESYSAKKEKDGVIRVLSEPVVNGIKAVDNRLC
jgi:hypothetical protein